MTAWRWMARHSGRTCAACLALDGQTFDTRERMGTHPNCSCVMVPVTRTWAELGLEDVPETRPAAPPDGEAWLRGQPEPVQRQVLGDVKWRAWKVREIVLADLVGERRDPRWGVVRWERSLKEVLGAEEAKLFRMSARFNDAEKPGREIPIPAAERKKLYQGIEQAKRLIRHHRGQETLIVYDVAGRGVFAKRVRGDLLEMSPREMELIQGKTLLHNHPADNSFSVLDVETACNAEAAVMIAVSIRHTYILHPPSAGWNAEYWIRVLRLAFEQEEQQVMLGRNRSSREEYEADYYHEIWSRVAQRKSVAGEALLRYNRIRE